MGYTAFDDAGTLIHDGVPSLLTTTSVTGNFFTLLGVGAQVGRVFRFDETWDVGANVVVISDHLWRQQFGADRSLIGKTILFDSKPLTVVGVAPRDFRFPTPRTDLWRPMAWPAAGMAQVYFRRAHWIRAVARLAPGVTIDQASAQLTAVAAQLKSEYPATNRVMDAELAPLHRFLIGDTRLPLLVLLASAGLLLLIACANVGNLLLVRAAARERELALRVALGATRFRLVRQAFTESLVLSLIGGAAGLALGWWGTRTLGALVPAGMLRVSVLGVDWNVVWYVLALTTACGLLFGMAPASWASRRDPNDALKSGGRGAQGGVRAHGWGQRLAVAEIAIALLLTVGAGLVIRSYALLQRVNPGFDARGVITMSVNIPDTGYDSARKVIAFFDDLVARARALPGVTDAAVVTHLSLSGQGWSSDFSVQGASAGHFASTLLHRQVTPNYFSTMRVPLLRGRWFTAADRGEPAVAVINAALARANFAGRDPIGQQITFDRAPTPRSTWRTIVGVVGDEHQNTPATPAGIEVFEPMAQAPSRAATLVARTTGDPTALAPALRRVVADLDPRLAIADLRPMTDVQAVSMARDRFLMTLLSLFGVVGLILAVVGVYGVVAQLARGRTREMGIRLALGASSRSVRWLVVRHGLRLAGAGLVAGGIVALLTTRALARLLFGVAPTDPLTFGVVVFVLLGASVVASWIPGVMVARVDPARTLREE